MSIDSALAEFDKIRQHNNANWGLMSPYEQKDANAKVEAARANVKSAAIAMLNQYYDALKAVDESHRHLAKAKGDALRSSGKGFDTSSFATGLQYMSQTDLENQVNEVSQMTRDAQLALLPLIRDEAKRRSQDRATSPDPVDRAQWNTLAIQARRMAGKALYKTTAVEAALAERNSANNRVAILVSKLDQAQRIAHSSEVGQALASTHYDAHGPSPDPRRKTINWYSQVEPEQDILS